MSAEIHLSSSFPSKYLHGVMKARVNLKDSVFSSRLKKKGKKELKSRLTRGGFVYVGGALEERARNIDVPK